MRVLLQRVSEAELCIDGESHAQIGRGYVLLVCAEQDDAPQDAQIAIDKVLHLRLFRGEGAGAKPMDRSILDIKGSILVVSQFTLAARVSKGRRPSFDRAMPPTQAKALYEHFLALLRATPVPVQCGVFGANMQVSLTNDGPVTVGFRVVQGKIVDDPTGTPRP